MKNSNTFFSRLPEKQRTALEAYVDEIIRQRRIECIDLLMRVSQALPREEKDLQWEIKSVEINKKLAMQREELKESYAAEIIDGFFPIPANLRNSPTELRNSPESNLRTLSIR